MLSWMLDAIDLSLKITVGSSIIAGVVIVLALVIFLGVELWKSARS